jgi:hypothetical protein
MNILSVEWQNEQLFKLLKAIVEHDEYLVEKDILNPFFELERARFLITRIERMKEEDSEKIAEESS